MLGSRSLEGVVRRARHRLASGDYDHAQRIVARGMERYPNAEALTEVALGIRRAQAHAGIRELKARIQHDQAPPAYEELIELYGDLGLSGEARQLALAYARAHPDLDSPHLILGEMHLQVFYADLLARDGHAALHSLTRAAELNPEAVKPHLLLSELFFCVGADGRLAAVIRDLAAMGRGDPLIESIVAELNALTRAEGGEELDGLFERVEVDGRLARSPTEWPLGRRDAADTSALSTEGAQKAVDDIVARGHAEEIVVIKRRGDVLAYARKGEHDDGSGEGHLADVTRAVAETVSQHAREFDLGAFKRCTIEGPFGLAAVGEIGGVMTGVRWRAKAEPQRLWERLTVGLEDALGGSAR
jgi:hypothetical protein